MKSISIRRKKLLTVMMAGVLAIGSLTACGKNDSQITAAEETTVQESAIEETGLEETVAETEQESSQLAVVGDDGTVREELTAVELTKLMGNGTNLGNTMEAYGHSDLGTTAEVSKYETYWGQPVTTQEMITGMKEAGFDSIRIPIAWTNAMDFESGDYTIGEEYLNRIEELINYARNASMYVIINDHWDGSWWGMFGSSKEEDREKAMEMYVSMWTQIAERYKD